MEIRVNDLRYGHEWMLLEYYGDRHLVFTYVFYTFYLLKLKIVALTTQKRLSTGETVE